MLGLIALGSSREELSAGEENDLIRKSSLEENGLFGAV